MIPEEYAEQIKSAVSALDKTRAAEICHDLIASLPSRDEAFPIRPAKSILAALRRKSYFELMCQLADALIANGQDDAQIRRQYSQALIDAGHLGPALALLREIANDPEADPCEGAEAFGLMGRVHKQRYVNSPTATPDRKQRLLNDALDCYQRVFATDRDRYLWHGINVVALEARGEQDKMELPTDEDFRTIAREIGSTIADKDDAGSATMWDYGTAMEAAVALKDVNGARHWASKYVASGADSFELRSTLRQLNEVWQITSDDELGQQVVPLLQASLLQAENGSLTIDAERFSDTQRIAGSMQLERVFGVDAYKRIRWLKMGLDRCEAVGLVGRRDGTGVGTGFVIWGKSLSESLDEDWYFLTNSHVITDDDEVIRNSSAWRKPLRPREAFITFELLFDPNNPEYSVGELVWTSPPNELDATLVRLKGTFGRDRDKQFAITRELPAPEDKKRIYIAGHPSGGGLTISLHDNHLLDYNERLMQYRTPTDPGSSGSPVFNDQWELVGLHHAGSSEKPSLANPAVLHEANEGIRISAIIDAIDV